MKHVREFIPQKEDKILIVSPHPDDETLGCGGLIIKYHEQVDILLLSAGEEDDDPDELIRKKKKRLSEFESALSVAGRVHCVTSLDLPLYGIKRNKHIIRSVSIRDYQYVFVPHRREHHPDHKCLYRLFLNMMRKQNRKATLIEYESTTALQNLYYYVDLSMPEMIVRKKRMMNSYESQIAGFNYEGIHIGLSMYQGALVHKEYVEAFYRVPTFYRLKQIYALSPVIVKRIIEKIYAKMKK